VKVKVNMFIPIALLSEKIILFLDKTLIRRQMGIVEKYAEKTGSIRNSWLKIEYKIA